MDRNSGLDEVWLRRHDDDSSLKKTKGEFKFSKVIQTLESEDKKMLTLLAIFTKGLLTSVLILMKGLLQLTFR